MTREELGRYIRWHLGINAEISEIFLETVNRIVAENDRHISKYRKQYKRFKRKYLDMATENRELKAKIRELQRELYNERVVNTALLDKDNSLSI